MFERKFNGKRLREGRIYRGFTITDLAEELEVSKQMISKYENGKATPTFEALMKMTNVLNFPKEYFYEKPVDVKVGSTYFRSLLSTGKKEREMQYDRVKYISIIRSMLEEYVEFPELDIPSFSEEELNDVEYIAKKLRAYWGLDDKPIKNIVRLLEKKGFVLASMNINKRNIDAFGANQEVKGKSYYTIVLGNNKSFYRRQFDVAHELGHKILHDTNLDLDDLSREEFKQIEQEANDFAAAFLLPKEGFIKDVTMHPNNLNYYKQLKKKWCVSIGGMVMRAYKLNVLSRGTYDYMQRMISKNGWRKQEPLDEIKLLKEPIGMVQAVELLIENDYIGKNEFLLKLSHDYGLSLHREEVEELIGLEDGYLHETIDKQPENIISLKQIRQSKINNKTS